MKITRSWLWYTLIRLAAFVIPLGLLLLLGIDVVVAAVVAAIIGLCVSYIFFAKWRSAISTELFESRQHKSSASKRDEDVEDSAVDNAAQK